MDKALLHKVFGHILPRVVFGISLGKAYGRSAGVVPDQSLVVERAKIIGRGL